MTAAANIKTPDPYESLLDSYAAKPTPATNYDSLIEKHASANDLDPDLLRAVIHQESRGRRQAVSPKGAQGLMQLIPATAARFGVTDPTDADQNIRGGAKYLKFLLKRFNGNVDLALAGYNAGEGAVDKFGGIPPYRETQNYVKSIRANYQGSGFAQQPQDQYESLLNDIEKKAKPPAPSDDYEKLLDSFNSPAAPTPPVQGEAVGASPTILPSRGTTQSPATFEGVRKGVRGTRATPFAGVRAGVRGSTSAETGVQGRSDAAQVAEAMGGVVGAQGRNSAALLPPQPTSDIAGRGNRVFINRQEPETVKLPGRPAPVMEAYNPTLSEQAAQKVAEAERFLGLNTQEGIKITPAEEAARNALDVGTAGVIRLPHVEPASSSPKAQEHEKQLIGIGGQLGSVAGVVAPFAAASKIISVAKAVPELAGLVAALEESGPLGRAAVRASEGYATFGGIQAAREVTNVPYGESQGLGQALKNINREGLVGAASLGLTPSGAGPLRAGGTFAGVSALSDIMQGKPGAETATDALQNLLAGVIMHRDLPESVKADAKSTLDSLREMKAEAGRAVDYVKPSNIIQRGVESDLRSGQPTESVPFAPGRKIPPVEPERENYEQTNRPISARVQDARRLPPMLGVDEGTAEEGIRLLPHQREANQGAQVRVPTVLRGDTAEPVRPSQVRQSPVREPASPVSRHGSGQLQGHGEQGPRVPVSNRGMEQEEITHAGGVSEGGTSVEGVTMNPPEAEVPPQVRHVDVQKRRTRTTATGARGQFKSETNAETEARRAQVGGEYTAGQRLPKDYVYHNTTPEAVGAIEREGLSAGAFSDKPIDFNGQPVWLAVKKTDLPNVQSHDYGGVMTHEPAFDAYPERGIEASAPVPPEKIYLVDKQGRVVRRLGTQPQSNVEPVLEGHTRFYRADSADVTKPQGAGWARDPEYVSQKYGKGQMGSESLWYIDVPDKPFIDDVGHVPSVINSETLKTYGVNVEPKLYRRVSSEGTRVGETVGLEGQKVEGGQATVEQPGAEAKVFPENQEGTGQAEGQVTPLRPSGFTPTDTYFNNPRLAQNRTYAWRSMGEKEYGELAAGRKTYAGTKAATRGNFLAPSPESAGQYAGRGKILVEFGGVNLGAGEGLAEGSVASRDSITKVWRFNDRTRQWEDAPDLMPSATPREVSRVPSESKAGAGETDATQPDWLKQNLDVLNTDAERKGIANKIEDLAAQRKTAKEIARQLGVDADTVRAVRSKRGIPGMDDKTAFEAWLSKRMSVGGTPIKGEEVSTTRAEATVEKPTPPQVQGRAKTEKVNPRTGLKPSQTEYLAGELEKVADRHIAEVSGEGAKSPEEIRRAGGLPEGAFRQPMAEPVTIKVPDDGEFTIRSAQGANRLHQQITGKPIEGFGRASKGYSSSGVSEAERQAKRSENAHRLADVAVQMYGEPLVAAAEIRRQAKATESEEPYDILSELDKRASGRGTKLERGFYGKPSERASYYERPKGRLTTERGRTLETKENRASAKGYREASQTAESLSERINQLRENRKSELKRKSKVAAGRAEQIEKEIESLQKKQQSAYDLMRKHKADIEQRVSGEKVHNGEAGFINLSILEPLARRIRKAVGIKEPEPVEPSFRLRGKREQANEQPSERRAVPAVEARSATTERVSRSDASNVPVTRMAETSSSPRVGSETSISEGRSIRSRSFPKSAEEAGLSRGTNLTYAVVGDKPSVERANKRIEANGADRVAADIARTGEPTKDDIVAGQILARKYSESGDHEREVAVINDLADKLTRAGQAVQAASLISRLSPEGVLLRGQKILNKRGANRTLTQEESTILKDSASKVREAEAKISDLEKQIEQMRAGSQPSVRGGRARLQTLEQRLAQAETDARARLAARKTATIRGGQAGASIIPLDIADYSIIGASKLARRGISLAKWTDEMVSEFGEEIRPHLRKIYQASYQGLRDERAKMRAESQERTVRRENPTVTDSAEIKKLINQRLNAQTEARNARQELARTFDRLGRSPMRRGFDTAMNALGLSRALVTLAPFHAAFRHTKAGLATHPIEWAKSAYKSAESLSTKQYERVVSEMQLDDDFKYAQKFKLGLTGDFGGKTGAAGMEEAFQSDFVHKIPGIKHSGQAFDTMVNVMRMGWFKQYMKYCRNLGLDPDNPNDALAFKQGADLINNATGRGTLPRGLDSATPTLNNIFFSTRFWASRLKLLTETPLKIVTPESMGGFTRPARVEAFKTLFNFTALVGAQLALAHMAGAKVSFNPDDPDFLQAGWGRFHLDLSAGLRTHIKTAIRLVEAMGQQPGGRQKEFGDILGTYVRQREAPITSGLHDIAAGKNVIGEPVYAWGKPGTGFTGRVRTSRVVQMFTPMVLPDAEEGLNQSSLAESTAAGFAKAFGEGGEVYAPRGHSGSSPFARRPARPSR